MARTGIRVCLATCLAVGLAAGCAHSNADHPYPPDPLLLSKHPVVGKFDALPAPQMAFTAPLPPEVPDMAVAETEQKPDSERVVPATPVSNPGSTPR